MNEEFIFSKYVKSWLKFIPDRIKMGIKDRITKDPLLISKKEISRLEKEPRLSHTYTKLLGNRLELVDPYWFLWSYREIFIEQIYLFRSVNLVPFIVDCGSNIGLSVIYYKHLYPNAKILAFEPDEIIFQILQRNIKAFGLSDIITNQKAVWVDNKDLIFKPDGSLGGKLVEKIIKDETIQVQSVRLKDYLNTRVDFLKIDIEGAENVVLKDCAGALDCVDNLFIEYHGEPDRPQNLHEILEILQLAGFRYHIKDANPIKYPFLKEFRNNYFDLQLNIFGYRV